MQDDRTDVDAHLRMIALRQALTTCNRGSGRAMSPDDLESALREHDAAIRWRPHLTRLLDGDVAPILHDLVLARVCSFSDLEARFEDLDLRVSRAWPWIRGMASQERGAARALDGR